MQNNKSPTIVGDLLFAWNLINSFLMAATFELGGEILVHDGTGCLLRDEASGHHQHIGIVVLTDEMGNLRNPAETCTDGLVLVEGHVDALTGATNGDAWEYLALLDTLSQCVAEVGVVAGVLGVGAVVLILIAFFLEVLLDELFQGKACVVGCYTNYFDIHSYFVYGLQFTVYS